MEKLFRKTSVKLPNKSSTKEKRRYLFHAIGGSWYVEKLGQKLPPVKKSKVRKNPKRG